jgi:extracellular factor (EF) 3-hydroxypalmitic acid methyl ester biosynthesis protein
MITSTNPSRIDEMDSVVRFFTEDVAKFTRELAALEQEIDPNAVPQLNDAFHQRTLKAFEESQVACREFELAHRESPEVVTEVQRRFREETNRWFSMSWIGNRARTKPNGFVGDFDMLVKLYDEATPARGLGGYLDLCILDLPLARAVRTRLADARRFLLKEISTRNSDVRILDVASGPCREYRNWPASPGIDVEIVAMDTDPNALDFVQSEVCPQMPKGTALRPVRYNAFRTASAEATIRQFGKFDMMYSVGLCDYLTDDNLIRLFDGWWHTLNENGVMYIAFKDCEQYDHTPYQWHLDWFFYQRTREDMDKLFAAAGLNVDAMEISRDGTGIIINFVTRQASGIHRRVDEAETVTPNVTTVAPRAPASKQEH